MCSDEELPCHRPRPLQRLRQLRGGLQVRKRSGLGRVPQTAVSVIGPVGEFPDIEQYWLPMQCQQCENPGCIEVCPTGASYRDEETGVVLVNAEDCIGLRELPCGLPLRRAHAQPQHERGGEVHAVLPETRRREVGARLRAQLLLRRAPVRRFGRPRKRRVEGGCRRSEENCHHVADPGGLAPATVYILHASTAAWQDDPSEVVRYGRRRS